MGKEHEHLSNDDGKRWESNGKSWNMIPYFDKTHTDDGKGTWNLWIQYLRTMIKSLSLLNDGDHHEC